MVEIDDETQLVTLKKVVSIDLETTGLIDAKNNKFPYILEFAACLEDGCCYYKYILPIDADFTITQKATEINGWTKTAFLKKAK